MTKIGILHLRTPRPIPIMQSDLQPRPGHTHGQIITDYPASAVERLRAHFQQSAATPPPTPKGDTQPMTKTAPTPNDTPTAVNPPSPFFFESPATTPAPPPSTAVEKLPFPTLHDFTDKNPKRRGAFIRRHFPAWLSHQEEHNLPRKEIIEMVGIAPSAWWTHSKGIQETPAKYGPSLDDIPFATMNDCNATDEPTRQAFITKHFPTWYAHWKLYNSTITLDSFLDMINLPADTWHNHVGEREAQKAQAAISTAPRPKVGPLPTPNAPQPTHGRFDQSPRTSATKPAQYANLIDKLGQLVEEIRGHGIQINVEVTYTTKL